ncbi:hypothetical protein MRB53_011489 [Persea americana]|uniref:Uncharacterized protein n=1 Tax=Persea americana TaxID=3435 RepID=A0ACC2LV04_PERAE|nr:hypothetical protein MRB53_011489 [Persea americana]
MSESRTSNSNDDWTFTAVPAISRTKVQILLSSPMKTKQPESSHSSENPGGSLSSGGGRSGCSSDENELTPSVETTELEPTLCIILHTTKTFQVHEFQSLFIKSIHPYHRRLISSQRSP